MCKVATGGRWLDVRFGVNYGFEFFMDDVCADNMYIVI